MITKLLIPILLAAALLNSAQGQMLNYHMDTWVNGTNAPNAGSYITNAYFAGNATNGGDGTGVTGAAGDRALHLTNGFSSGRLEVAQLNLTNAPLTSFTICGWYKLDATAATGWRLFDAGGNGAAWQFNADGTVNVGIVGWFFNNVGSGFAASGVWTFIAVTYENTGSAVKVYRGNVSAGSLQLVYSGIRGAVATASFGSGNLELGNTQGLNRSLQGWLDEFRLYGATSGVGGALDSNALESIRAESSTALAGAAAACVIDWTNVCQRIDGFGAASVGPSPLALMDLFFSTNSGIGLSLLRFRIAQGGGFGSANDPTIMQQAVARGASVWAAPWSPATTFKTVNANGVLSGNGGNFNGTTANYINYARQLSGYVANVKTNYGVALTALSIQNEPNYIPTNYESCGWSAQQLHDFVPYLSSALAASSVATTKIMLPESSKWAATSNLQATAMNDPSVAPMVDIIANHNYDGPDFQTGDTNIPAAITNYGKALWETEVSTGDAFDGSINNAVYWAGRIHLFLTAAQVNAWHFWNLITGNPTNEGLTDSNGVPAKRLYALGNFSRFVRPNYYRIGVPTNSGSVQISAYKNPGGGQFAIVAINSSSFLIVTQTFSVANLSGSISNVTPWLTSATLSLANQAPVAVNAGVFTYTLPPLSIATFAGQAVNNPAQLLVDSATATVVIGNANGYVDPGETVDESVVLRNVGNLAATNITATISCTNAGVSLLTNTAAYPDAAGLAYVTNATPFRYVLAKSVPAGTVLQFKHIATLVSGVSFTNAFTQLVGQNTVANLTNTYNAADAPLNTVYNDSIYSTNLVTQSGIVDKVTVGVRMDFTPDSQAFIALQYNGGSDTALSLGQGGSGANFGTGDCSTGTRTIFDDDAATAISAGMAPFSGNYQPSDLLSGFDGLPAAGTWRLRVTSTSPNAGTLQCWSLTVVSSVPTNVVSIYNTAPVGNGTNLAVPYNAPVTFNLSASDANGDAFTFITNTPPTHGTLSGFNPATGAITYTPANNYQGGDSFTFSAADGYATGFVASVTLNVAGPATPLLVMTSSLNPSIFSQSITFTATVSGTNGIPTGTVQFQDNGASLGSAVTLNGSGVAGYSTTALTAGSHPLSVIYGGDSFYSGKTNYLSGGQTVNQPAPPSAGPVIFVAGNAAVSFSGQAGVTYITEAATNLPGPWRPVSTNVADGAGLWTVTNAIPAAQQFYRSHTP